jgi:hypothetical protein
MKSFIKKTLYFLGIPLILLVGIYITSDPFKTIKSFDLSEFSIVNRDYLSTELYLKNEQKQKYDSFIFGSSRGCGLNTYKWKSYLSKGSNQFLFQSWGETITGIYQKISYLESEKVSIKNAIVLLDIPSSFRETQEPKTALGLKHYKISGKSKIYFQSILFYSFLKPSEIFKSTKEIFIKPNYDIGFDTISNDWYKSNKENWKCKPEQDSTLNKGKFGERPKIEVMSKELIKPEFESLIKKIKYIFDKQKSDYKIIITPAYDQMRINKQDLYKLQRIFGKQNVYTYSGKNALTEDKFNFMDINHFDDIVGWEILKDIYRDKE